MFSLEIRKRDNTVRVLLSDEKNVVASACGGVEDGTADMNVQVNPNERGRGLGKQAVVAFLGVVSDMGAKRIVAEVKPEFGLKAGETRNFYERLGFDVGEDGSLSKDL